jgi:hypothetical protein
LGKAVAPAGATEIPNAKSQAPSNPQTLNSKFSGNPLETVVSCFANWDLKIIWDLELGIWDFERAER